jgi:hypothetical protein
VETEKVILLYLTVPPALMILAIVLYELKIFRMAVVIVLAAMAALFEKLDKRYERARKEI